MSTRDQRIADNLHLVDQVMRYRNRWPVTAYESPSLRRSIDKEDLHQAGVVGLIKAADKFPGPDDEFAPYASAAIYNAIVDCVASNISPVSTSNHHHHWERLSVEMQDKLGVAVRCKTMTNGAWVVHGPTSPNHYDPAVSNEKSDFTDYCINKLREALSEDAFTMLRLKSDGATYDDIGRELGISPQRVHIRQKGLYNKCRFILHNEIEEGEL